MARATTKKTAHMEPPGEARRRSILEGSLKCFVAKGYLATSISDIREASGATTGSIYHFFDGKGAIALALFEVATKGLKSEIGGNSADAAASIKALAGGLVTWGLKNPDLFRFVDEVTTISNVSPEFEGLENPLLDQQVANQKSYGALVKARKVKDLPWAAAEALILGPAYNYLRQATGGRGGRIAAKRAADLFADAAWAAVAA